GKSFTWVSERDGWTKAYVVSRDGRQVRSITPGAYDVIGIHAVDERGGWLYFMASPDNPTQRYLHRVRLDGKGKLERVSPAGQQGTHGYNLSPDARWAIHTYSKFGTPPVMALIRLPEHRNVRTVVTNTQLAARVDALRR